MDIGHADRPTSGASPTDLVAQLREVRHRTRRLTEDLSSAELLGPYLEIVNPVLWELGHIAWFHEYWTLRGAAGRAPLIERSDKLWDSSNVPHKTRWHLDLPDRAGTYGYMADVLARQEELLGRSLDDATRYYYDLSIRHEDMHIEALTYMRQTSSNAAPRISVWRRRSMSRRSPAPLMTTLRRLAGIVSTASTSASIASGLWP